jgi:hypothetical protein
MLIERVAPEAFRVKGQGRGMSTELGRLDIN